MKEVTPLRSDRWMSIALSIAGDSHKRSGLPCQDASAAAVDQIEQWAYAIVSDGHGSERYFRSDRGAKIAVEVLIAAFDNAKRFALDTSNGQGILKNWEDWAPQWVLAQWRRLLYEDLLADPPSVPGVEAPEPGLTRLLDHIREQKGYAAVVALCRQIDSFGELAGRLGGVLPEGSMLPDVSDPRWRDDAIGDWQVQAYGATLLGVLVSPQILLWFQLGDGAMVEVRNGTAAYLVPPHDAAIANEAPSLCMPDAVRLVRVGGYEIGPEGVPESLLMATDGIPNFYETIEGFFEFCATIAHLATTSADVDEKLSGWLPAISASGSGDDVSVAIVKTATADLSADEAAVVSASSEEPATNAAAETKASECQEPNAEKG